MDLAELAYACHIYGVTTDFDRSYLTFLEATGREADLSRAGHRHALLVWLNSWGCRQFRPSQYDDASRELEEWYTEFVNLLPPRDLPLWHLGMQHVHHLGVAYEALRVRRASSRVRDGQEYGVSVGPTGASKALFALRPEAALPWDIPARQAMGYDGTGKAYTEYLVRTADTAKDLARQCAHFGLRLEELPTALGRPHSTPLRLIDEYQWVVLSRQYTRPEAARLDEWQRTVLAAHRKRKHGADPNAGPPGRRFTVPQGIDSLEQRGKRGDNLTEPAAGVRRQSSDRQGQPGPAHGARASQTRPETPTPNAPPAVVDGAMSKTLPTWAGHSTFRYSGSVCAGTRIHFGASGQAAVSRGQYREMLRHFVGRAVEIGTSRTDPPEGSLGEWLQEHVTRTATASYVGPILVQEGYAERVHGQPTRIRIVKTLG